ncbi:MAG: HDOD domain-containing protein, partial [Proteobacteria bacterium]
MSKVALKTCNTCLREFLTPEDFLTNTSRWRICDQGHLWFNCSCHSTGIILKGKFPWYNPSHQLSGEAQSIFNLVTSEQKLPRLPNYVMELQKLLEDPKATTQQMADVIKHDGLLATSVLKVANSQKAGDGQPIRSLSHAIAFIGLDSLRDMVIVAAVSRFELKTRVFSAAKFWDKAFFTGRIAEYLVKHFQLNVAADQAFLAGSTCNIGKIVQALLDPRTVDIYVLQMEDLKIKGSWTQAEIRNKGYPHTILGEIGAASWGFPDEMLDAIGRHHELTTKFKLDIELWEVAALANQL